MMNTYKYFIIIILLSLQQTYAQSPKSIIKGTYTSTKKKTLLKTFAVSKGDIVEFKITSLHKNRGVNIWVKQHPGNLEVLFFTDLQSDTKKIVAPADAIYDVFYGGTKLDFNIEINYYSNNSHVAGRGGFVYVRMPDTLHASSYVDYTIGNNINLTPYKEKVLLSTIQEPNQIISRDFITGVDYLEVDIPGNIIDEYREQKLLSYNITLTCGELSMYNAMIGVVDAGLDLALDKIGGKVKGKMKDKMNGKTKKGSMDHQYQFTDKNLDEESNKLETLKEVVSIVNEGAEELNDDNDSTQEVSDIAFVLDGGIQEVILEKAMDAAGVPQNIQAIYGKIQNFPDVGDIVKDNVHKLIPKAKGSARIIVQDKRLYTKHYPVIPEKEFWIQSAMNYGQNSGACFDIGGHPRVGKKGQNISIWNIDEGADRKYKLVPSKYKGYYKIVSSLPGNVVVDVSGGKTSTNAANIQLWEDNNTKAQQFYFKHLGNGKFKIMTLSDYVICTDSRKNDNGTNIHIWENQNGAWAEWYLVDPITKKAFIPTQTREFKYWDMNTVFDKKGSVIAEAIDVDSTIGRRKKIYIAVGRNGIEAKAKLLVEANYEIKNYTDVIKYKRVETPVQSKDFWTAYKIKYHYDIVFKDQLKPYYEVISKADYYSGFRPKEEDENETNKYRLSRYKYLTQK